MSNWNEISHHWDCTYKCGGGTFKIQSFHKQTQLKYWINDKINSNNNNNSQTFTTPSNPVLRDCLSLLSHECFHRARYWIVCIIFNDFKKYLIVFKTRLAPTIRLLPNHHSFNNSKIRYHLQRKFIFFPVFLNKSFFTYN